MRICVGTLVLAYVAPFLIVGCAVAPAHHTAEISATEIAVIRGHFVSEEKDRTLVVLREMSRIWPHEWFGQDWTTALRRSATLEDQEIREAVEDLISRNLTNTSFSGISIPELKLRIVPDGVLNAMFSDLDEGWKEFRRRFDDANLHGLSRVGFSKDMHTAIYFASFSCGSTCGGSGFHVMRYKDGAWTPDKNVRVGWVTAS